eukprot:6492972-Prymnesium_polylepis.1
MPEKAAGPVAAEEAGLGLEHLDERLDRREAVGLDDHCLDRRVLLRQLEHNQCDHDVLTELKLREALVARREPGDL